MLGLFSLSDVDSDDVGVLFPTYKPSSIDRAFLDRRRRNREEAPTRIGSSWLLMGFSLGILIASLATCSYTALVAFQTCIGATKQALHALELVLWATALLVLAFSRLQRTDALK